MRKVKKIDQARQRMGAGKCQPSILEQIKKLKNKPILKEN